MADVVLSGEVPARVWLPPHPGPLSTVERRAPEHASVVLSLELHGTALVATLRAHLTHRLDRQATAQALLVHPNTISQRLRRVETLTNLDLRDPAAAVEARSALTVLDVADGLSRRSPRVS